jgi:hypothetical protein
MPALKWLEIKYQAIDFYGIKFSSSFPDGMTRRMAGG